MNTNAIVTAVAGLLLASSAATAQFVKGNEAVQILPDGSRRVETPPTASALLARPCAAANPGCSGGGWNMVETAEGLQECTEIYARNATCRPSTYGKQRLMRVWVVKIGSRWMHCSMPDAPQGCVSISMLPSPRLQ